MTKSCCIPNCKENSLKKTQTGERVSFHCLPKKPELRNEWIRVISELSEKPFKPTNFTLVCSKHFAKSDYLIRVKSGKRYLTDKSVPSIFPPKIVKPRPKWHKLKNSLLKPPLNKTIALQTDNSNETATPVELRANYIDPVSVNGVAEIENPILPDADIKIETSPNNDTDQSRHIIAVDVIQLPQIPIDAAVSPSSEHNLLGVIESQRKEIEKLRNQLSEKDKEVGNLVKVMNHLEMKCDEERKESHEFLRKLKDIYKNMNVSSMTVFDIDEDEALSVKVKNEEVLRVSIMQMRSVLNEWKKKLLQNSLQNSIS